MSISTQMDVLDELCSRVGNINLESSRASITSVGKLEDESIYVKEQTGNESVDDNACVQFARLQDTSSVEGSPTVTLPVYITPSTFPGKEGELLLIPARRMSNYNVAIQGPNEKKTESSNVVENDPEDHDCISTVEVMNQISSSNFVTSSELNASDIDKFDENIVQNILNNSFTDLAESDSDEEQTNLNPKEEISKLSSKTVLNSTFTECDLSKGTEESSLYTMEKGSIHYNDSSSTLTSISGVCASLKESCGNILFTEITAKADLDCTESEYCAAESTERLQVIQSDTLLQESNILRCEVVTCDSVVENCELQNEVSSLISKSNTDGMASISKEKESLPYNNSPLKRELKAYVIECSSKDRNEMFQTLSEKLTTHEMKNFQEIAEKTRDCETVLNNSLDVAAEELAEELNVSQITSDVETVLNTSFIESPSSGVTCTETILNTSFIEVEGNGKKDDAEIVTTQKLASNTCEFQKSISDNAINAVEISKSCKNSVEEDRVQDVHNDTFTEELQKLSSENCEFGKSLNDKMVGAVEFSDSDKNCIGKNSIQDICNDTFVEEAVRNLKLKDSPLENSTENVLNTSFMECTSIAGEQMITTENSSCVKTESCGPLSESIERDLSVPEDNGTEETTFEIDTLISVTVNKDPKAVVEGSISFANSIVEGNCASFNGNTAEVVNTSTSPGNIEQAENPFESSLNQTYFENANMEVEENASFIRTERQAQNVSFTEYSGKMDEILVVDTESMKSQNTMLRELSSETLTIHNEMKKNIANETSSKAILNINFTEEFSENIIKSEINALMSIEEPEMNTTLETVKLGMNLPLDTLAPDMNTPLDTVAPEMNTTLNIVKPENTTMDTVESEMNATLDIVKPGVNTSLYTVSPEMNTSLDTESPEMNISLDTVAPEKNISLHTVAPKMNISLDTVAPEMNTSLDTVAPEMNTSLDTVAPEMNTSLDTVAPEMNTTLDIVEPKMNTTLDIIEPKVNTTLDIVKPKMNTTLDIVASIEDRVDSEINTTDIVVESGLNTTMDIEVSKINTENIVSENRELNSTFCFTETVLDSTFAEPTVPDKIEKPNQDTSQRMTPQNCEMNVLSQAGITSTVPLVCQEVDIENAGKTSSTESIVERVVENQNIRSDDLVHQRKKLSEVPNVTKIDLNLTFDTYSEQPLNISETGREQNATFKELSDSKGAVKVLVNENCDLERGKSALKTDLNSTFVTASDLLFEDSETTQDTTSTTKKNVENQIISSTVLASKDDVLINDTAGVRTDLNSSFLHETQTKVASPNVKAGKIEITQSVKFSQKGMTNNPGVNNGSCKDTSVHEKQIINDESFVNKCKESVSRERNILNAGVLQDSQELVIKKTNQKSVIEKIEASLANNGEETEQITMVPVSDKKDNISTNLTELKSNSISSSNEVCSFTPSGITDVYKQSSDVLSHETFNQNPASNNTLNPCAEVQNESVPLQKSDGIENIYEQKHELIEFDAVLNNFSLINLDKKNCDMNRIEKLSIVCAEEMNIPCGKKEVKTPEGEFKCIQMTPNNVGTSTLDHQIKELMAKGALVEDACEKRERTTYMKNPQENRHENILSKDINIEIQRNLDGICPVVEALPSQKLKPEELSTATIDLLTPAANEFLSNGENEQFQDSNFVFGDEVFKDPSTFDFLTQFGNSTSLRDLRKESLYIKFDPLVGSPRSATASDKPLPIVNIVREEERGENEKINITAEANNEKRETLHGICKGVSEGSVESFLRSKSPLVGPKELQDESALLKLKEYQEECNSLKAQIAELQEIIKAKDEVHKNEITKYTSQIVALDFDLARQGEIISQYKKDLEEKEGEKLAFDSIMSEYEKLLSQLVTEKEQNCIEFNQKEFKLTKELKECREKLAETEQKLSIAQQKCENLQNSMKKHVDTLLVKMKSYEKAVEKEKQKYATIKEHAAEQLESANEKLMAEEKRHKLECTKYTSSIANLELQVTNLQNLLDQKTKENDTLMAMCNELVERFEH